MRARASPAARSQATETTNASGHRHLAALQRQHDRRPVHRNRGHRPARNAAASFSTRQPRRADAPTLTDGQGRSGASATVGTRYAKPLEVKVRDAHGKPLQGATSPSRSARPAAERRRRLPASAPERASPAAAARRPRPRTPPASRPRPAEREHHRRHVHRHRDDDRQRRHAASFALHNLAGTPATITRGCRRRPSRPRVGDALPDPARGHRHRQARQPGRRRHSSPSPRRPRGAGGRSCAGTPHSHAVQVQTDASGHRRRARLRRQQDARAATSCKATARGSSGRVRARQPAAGLAR